MKYRLKAAIILSAIILFKASGQVPVGAWSDHLSYNRGTHVVVAGDRVYCAAGAGIIVYNKTDNSLEKLSKVHGLYDVDISSMEWSEADQVLIVGYTNGNLDIVNDNRIINISDILRSSVPGSKSINNIMVAGHNAYLSCTFGIVVVNLQRREISDTYYLGDDGVRLSINDMAFDGMFLYAATSSGLFRADIDAPNLLDFAYWERLDFLPGAGNLFYSVTWFDGKLYAVQLNSSGGYVTYQITGDSYVEFGSSPAAPFKVVTAGDDLALITESEASIYGPGASLTGKIDDYGYWGLAIRDIDIDPDGTIWIADRIFGLVRKRADQYNILTPPGPWSNRVFSISSYPGRSYFASGGYNQAFGNLFRTGEYSILSGRRWSSRLNYDIRDVLYVKEHPGDSDIHLLATWGYGLIEYRGGEFFKAWGEDNSSLRSIIPGSSFVRIGGMAFDADRNLWVINSGVPNPVSVRKANGEWRSFPYGGVINHDHTGRIIITGSGHKWVLLPRGGGLFAFDNGQDIDETSSDRMIKFSVTDENNSLISNEVFSIAEDNRGFIWVGTNTGVVVYYNPERVFSGDNFYARRIIVSGSRQDDIGYLLNNETVTAIAVDGADRKWFGTQKSGVFLVSDDGTRQIHHFTSRNSPLLSDNITDIDIDPATGEVFFGTSMGVVSFRGEATSPGTGFTDVYIFPNPVRENYDGPITVTGLMKDSIVKFTDISGNLVYETVSLGGQAVWDGRNFRGRRVHTGIYLIFISNADGSQTHVSKLMFIN